jgi:hypothetical protein
LPQLPHPPSRGAHEDEVEALAAVAAGQVPGLRRAVPPDLEHAHRPVAAPEAEDAGRAAGDHQGLGAVRRQAGETQARLLEAAVPALEGLGAAVPEAADEELARGVVRQAEERAPLVVADHRVDADEPGVVVVGELRRTVGRRGGGPGGERRQREQGERFHRGWRGHLPIRHARIVHRPLYATRGRMEARASPSVAA